MKSFRSFCVAVALAACAVFPVSAFAGDADVQVAFSPDGGGEALVLSTIQSARISIRLLAYSFTAAPVVRALIAAKRRGVDVAVTVDYRNNIQEDRSGKARAALGALVNASIPVTVVSAYPLQHSKFLAVDSAVIQTGSYNYSQQAALYNSENVIVLRGRPDIVRAYLSNWNDVTARGQRYNVQ
jgi:phosphatidylserine/phosphatidylglycerophosphate/cardiolipin synthase-like enzyme